MKKKIIEILSYSPYGLFDNFRKNSRFSKRIKNQSKMIDFYVNNNEIKKMQIGCGPNLFEGWMNTDLISNDEIVFLDAGVAFPIQSDSFDFIYSEHLFEHLRVEQQINMLTESYRILKKGGVLRIATPDLDFLMKLYANPNSPESKDYNEWYVDKFPHFKMVKNLIADKDQYFIYVINNFFKAWGHQVIHNVRSLSTLALQCNFAQARECKVGESEIMAFKNIEKHGTVLPERINKFETMVLELTK